MNRGEIEKKTNLYVVLNPAAGNASGEEIHSLLAKYFPEEQYTYEVYETTGEENVAELTRAACEKGANRVFAAGGDGTVAAVVNGLVGTEVPLGVIPVGTGNGLARALRIPLETEEAIKVLSGDIEILDLDLMQVGEKFYTLNVSVGISGEAMRKTDPESKRRFGITAYVWRILNEVIGFNLKRFELQIDGKRLQIRATEILISNGSILENPPEPLGPPEEFKDGKLDVYIVSARTIFDYLRLVGELIFKSPKRAKDLHHMRVSKKIVVDAIGKAEQTQGDGEIIGKTPLEVTVRSEAIKVIVPKNTQKKGEKNS